MTRIFLIRHGQTDANAEQRYQGQIDTPLNKRGIAQAQWAAKQLKDLPLDIIVSSDLIRAKRTAEEINLFHQREHSIITELRERDFGAWENMTVPEIKKSYKKHYTQWQKKATAHIPKSERFFFFQKRILKGLKKVLAANAHYKNIAIIAHGGPNRIILHHFLKNCSRKNFWNIKQDNACINIIDIYPSAAVVSLINYHEKSFEEKTVTY